MIKRLILLFCCLMPALSVAVEIKGVAQIHWVQAHQPDYWLNKGTGIYQYDSGNDGLNVAQGLLAMEQDLADELSFSAVINYNQRPAQSIGLTQGYFKYKPIVPSAYKWQIQAGLFYPRMSLENPDLGWTSPYTYTNSAINSWLGEEIKTIGLELSVNRPGRFFNSPHSFNAVASVFKANDPAGTLLAWRGFALHDRQTSLNELVPFANLPSFTDTALRFQASNVRPFEEIDGRFGYYFGLHWDYYKQSQLRFYLYDNNGDPSVLNKSTGQYAWDTKFVSLAWQYKFDSQWRLITQAMHGNTAMGKSRGVDVDFNAYFALVSYQHFAHRWSLRYDHFNVIERDNWLWDPNDSHGEGLTIAWRFDLTAQWQVGLEYSVANSFAANRDLWQWPQNERQRQSLANLQYRF
ncbi:hypothetical protein ORJ66_11255 [Pseudoalteromonas tunicata]|uniref:hypothetical protein n=1 Tax=Pseudoalteromonas tunicata TaxID=314281 RepID=UPI00273E4DFF|nr:hypothetical protein [Pseudoalteromonas tunicata]MDP5213620.1 hypothetical protein [Pseudoalteromonas tunicata]